MILSRVFGWQKVERREEGVWIGLGLVGKMNEGYFRETNLFLPPYGLFINYMSFFINYFVQIGLGLGLISFRV